MIAATTHAYVRDHALGGEVSLHRTLLAATQPATVLTRTRDPYILDGIRVQPIATDDVLDPNADPAPIAAQLQQIGASVVLAQNELSLPSVRAARQVGIPSIVSVHAPPKYGRGIRQAVQDASHRIYNTAQSAKEWRLPGLVLHPPVPPLPTRRYGDGDAVTLLSNLANKGVKTVLTVAERMPAQRFLIVRSPAESTHGLDGFDEWAARLPNVTVAPRVAPADVPDRYLSQTRILVIPSRMETYGMSAIEAAGYGIPAVSIMNPHVAEGIGEAAYPIPGLNADALELGIYRVQANWREWSRRALDRAGQIEDRQRTELAEWADWLTRL